MPVTTKEDIKKDILDSYYWDARIDASDITVMVTDNGVVTLEGTVPSAQGHDAAKSMAWSVPGVTQVKDRLSVKFNRGIALPADTDIREAIEQGLRWSPDVGEENINVVVDSSVVVLEGTVASYWEKDRAEDIAMNRIGVIEVRNRLAVVPTKTEHDRAVAESIESAFARSFHIDEDAIDVKVADGDVTLTGEVSDTRAFNEAADLVRITAGVVSIDNQLTVQ